MSKQVLVTIMFVSLAFFQCTDKSNPYKDFRLADNRECSEIVSAILKQDTTFINKELLQSEYIGADLLPMSISMHMARDTSGIIEPEEHRLFRTSLLELRHCNMTDTFNQSPDSLYFAFQNDSSKTISVDTTVINFVKLADQEFIQINKGKYNFGYFQFSIPVLNKAKTKAFVRADFMCFGLCGEGMLYILDKKNDKWTLTLSKSEWVG